MKEDEKTAQITSVPEDLIDLIEKKKTSNGFDYKIDDIDIREFVSKCWTILSEEERKNYRTQLEDLSKSTSNTPTVQDFAQQLSRQLNSAYKKSKNNSNIEDELDDLFINFKYVNLSNSDLHKEKKLGIFANEPFKDSDFHNNPILTTSLKTALSTFPSMERSGHNQNDKDSFINVTTSILQGITNKQQGNMFNQGGALDPTLIVAVAEYVEKNFVELQKLSSPEQFKMGETFKVEYEKLYAKQSSLTKKGHPVAISPSKLANAFEEVTQKHNLLGKESVEIVTPKLTMIERLRQTFSRASQTTPPALNIARTNDKVVRTK